MDFFDYQDKASATATYPVNEMQGLTYCTLGLCGESGEFANKVKKIIRGDKTLTDAREDLIAELGDCLWYISELAKNLNVNLEEVAFRNIEKLQSRRARNVVKGDGDNR